ncbi:hypothetical protein ACJ72_05569 [Emergomyces africanus]|uniref:Uncharacterized protein n=1 Tax=Emergomyces africanus TaxID=1955775 RepID=A0A1B7NTM5_9EURO|nr:hypothetical protein ACJ72_05569 [Emergomyces africanus]
MADNISADLPSTQRKRRRAPYVSFGDAGTTASAGTFGSLLRLFAPESFWKRLNYITSGLESECPDKSEMPLEPPTLTFLDDRWPVVTYLTPDGFRMRVQLSCHENTIVQQVEVTNEETADGTLNLVLDPKFLLLDLDYVSFVSNSETTYTVGGPGNRGIVVTGAHLTDAEEEYQDLSVLITLFQKDVLQELSIAEPDNSGISTRRMQSPIPISRTIGASESIKFVAVFTLQFTGSTLNLVDDILAGHDLNSLLYPGSSFTRDHMRWPFPDEPEISWHLRRNLEHILSVCSLPLKGSDPRPNELSGSGLGSSGLGNDMAPVALTCGDFGDHRVCVSGSYFAFKFMLAMYKHLLEYKDPYLALLRKRIHETCRGHLKWISQLPPDSAFSSNIWVNGTVVSLAEGNTDLPPDAVANTPFHILKATEYLEVFREPSELIYLCGWLKDFIIAWLRRLRETKSRLTPTWEHAVDSSDVPIYRLGDQIWIWKALQNVEKLVVKVVKEQHLKPQANLERFLKLKNSLFGFTGSKNKCEDSGLMHTAEDIRKQNLIRFTVYNDILRRRMLSVTRTTRETRYLFHSRDTVLYYGRERGFFNDDRQPVWDQLVKAQIQHEDEAIDEDQWDNPLRYALAITMSAAKDRLDRSFEPESMAKRARRVIMDSSSENGLFPGQLDADSKEPLLFEREIFRDSYFHCGFEISYILFATAEKAKHFRATQKRMDTSQPHPDDEKQQPPEAPDTQFASPVPRGGVLDFQFNGLTVVMQRKLKRKNPSGGLVDLSNIVEIPDEWLYRYPSFLGFQPPQTDSEIWKTMDEPLDGRNRVSRTWEDFGGDDPHSTLLKALQDRTKRNARRTIIGAVRRGRNHRKQEDKVSLKSIVSNAELWDQLRRKRTAELAKKRLVCLTTADSARALMCYLASPDSEKLPLVQFFDRHAQSNASVDDDTAAAARNSWVTEVHFRFYQLEDTFSVPPGIDALDQTSSSRNLNSIPIRQLAAQSCLYFRPNTRLVEAAIGFRIDGDFFDRYWTCHLIEDFANPAHALDPEAHTLDTGTIDKWKYWWQRKILERILFNRILLMVCASAEEILKAVGSGNSEETSGADQIYASKNRFENLSESNLHECFQILVTLKNNLSDLQGVVLLWKSRESACGKDRPRWTRNDEERYAKHIKKNDAIMESRIMDLMTKEARAEFMISLVTNSQEANRSLESLREARHITAFTYVTVFFLPLGFAVGVFSMEKVPGREVITSMAITATVSLVITASVLSYSLNQVVRQYIQRFLSKMQKPPFNGSGAPSAQTSRSLISTLVSSLPNFYEIRQYLNQLRSERKRPYELPDAP